MEAEQGTGQGPVAKCADAQASAGQMLKFGTASCMDLQFHISQPENNATVSGSFVIAALDEPLFAAARVEFLVDGQPKPATRGLGWNYAWDTASLPIGSTHTIQAKAYDQSNALIGVTGVITVKIGEKTFTNPVINSSCADPGALKDGANYYVVCTTHTLPAFRIRTSSDLVHWTDSGKHVLTARAPWAGTDYYWAPELHKVGSTYVAHFTAKHASSGYLCVGAASASNPLGPYTADSQPLVCGNGRTALDSTYFADDNGKKYLYWKEDAAPGNPSGYLYARELDASGTKFASGSSSRQLFKNDLAWENPLVEGPWMMKHSGQYYLFYSGAVYSNNTYATGVARSSSPLGPFAKKGPPVLKSGSRWKGPGHGSFVHVNGTDYYVHHAWEGTTYDGVRKMLLAPVRWTNGWPEIGNGTPIEGSQSYP